jgi:hypothetical protein
MAAPDVLLAILTEMKTLQPGSSFVESLYQQYCNRGGLSKKQLEGLLDKVQRSHGIAPGKIATLQAIILKKPTRERSKPTINAAPPPKDTATGILLHEILERYPAHKRVLFLQSKYQQNDSLTTQEKEEIRKFHALLLKK